ncbi:hypothetical protein D9M71_183930 [compost metagenome]
MHLTQPRQLAQQQAHLGFVSSRRCRQVSDPWRIEAGLQLRFYLLPQRGIVLTQAHLMFSQMQPRPTGDDGTTGQ